MCVEQACPSAAHEERLEDAVAAGEHRVVDVCHGVGRRDDLTVEGDDDLAIGRHGA